MTQPRLCWSFTHTGDEPNSRREAGEINMDSSKKKTITRRRLLRNAALIASGSLGVPWASGFAQSAEQTWTIGNELVKRVVAFHANRQVPVPPGLFTQQLS